MSSSEKQLECFVCGQSTRNRCSSCAKAGLDIAFCSTEHQKLVWYAHKLVCGRGKACPFRHPKLNDAELEILRDDAFREQLNRVNEYVVLNNILALPFSTVLEHMLGAPEGSLMQNWQRLDSWISSLSPKPTAQSKFYRSLRSVIDAHDEDRRTSSAACAVSPFWAAAEMETVLMNAVVGSGVGHFTDVPGLSDRLAPVLHLAVIWSVVLRLELIAPGGDAPAIPQAKMIAQLERLLQSFADINPCRTLDPLTSLATDLSDRLHVPETSVSSSAHWPFKDPSRAAMSSSDKQLECFVCGQSTRNRCRSCAKAGLDIAFCSTEHQKLVWPVHKLVCGPGKARPFRHPTLNDAELEILRNPACQEELNSMAKHFIQEPASP
ncbi:hypothetical protein B0A53_05069 [Rhodotorula sp. CCFEE 5036]|nr:hypothetical protein B0A53_05069 [Rhodotorula sp. CCFEE 5036]